MSCLNNRALIITGGEIDIDWAMDMVHNLCPFLLIAADSGLDVTHKLKLNPDVIIGDFDSLKDPDLKDKYASLGSRIITLPCEKDLTDTHAACDVALENKAKEIIIIGATGTRLDHVLANIHLLKYISDNDASGTILNVNNRIRYLRIGEYQISKKNIYGKYISLLPIGIEPVYLTLEGFKYSVQELEVNYNMSIAVSNELENEDAILKISNTGCLMIESDDL